MNEITDNNLNALIRETFDRKQLLADLDQLIIADLSRQARRARIRRWTRALIFSFGVPVVLLIFATCMYYFIKQYDLSALTLLIIAWPTLAIIFTTHRALKTFSLEKE